jgi:hypothetical protein
MLPASSSTLKEVSSFGNVKSNSGVHMAIAVNIPTLVFVLGPKSLY